MEEALSFFRAFEIWIYLLLGLGGLYYIRKFFLAWQELRGANFGLEREGAQGRLNYAASALVLILTMAIIEFVLVSFIVPAMPEAIPFPTPTLDLLATPTITLPAGTPQEGELEPTNPSGVIDLSPDSGCVPGQIEITIPENGAVVNGLVAIMGTADIPTFDFYKLEIKRPDETVWLTIQAGNNAVQDDKLGDWDTSRLSPGEYQLGLVVVNDAAQASQPCTVLLQVAITPDTTPAP